MRVSVALRRRESEPLSRCRGVWFDSDAVDREPYMAPGLVTAEKAERGKLPTDVWWHTIVPTGGAENTDDVVTEVTVAAVVTDAGVVTTGGGTNKPSRPRNHPVGGCCVGGKKCVLGEQSLPGQVSHSCSSAIASRICWYIASLLAFAGHPG